MYGRIIKFRYFLESGIILQLTFLSVWRKHYIHTWALHTYHLRDESFIIANTFSTPNTQLVPLLFKLRTSFAAPDRPTLAVSLELRKGELASFPYRGGKIVTILFSIPKKVFFVFIVFFFSGFNSSVGRSCQWWQLVFKTFWWVDEGGCNLSLIIANLSFFSVLLFLVCLQLLLAWKYNYFLKVYLLYFRVPFVV